MKGGGVNLRELASSVSKNDAHVAKRARIEDPLKSNIPNFPPYEGVIFGCLTTIPSILKDPSYLNVRIEDLEIEARIGMFMTGNKRLFPRCSKRIAYGMDPKQRRETERNLDPFLRTQFNAGIDESFAKRLKLKLMKKDLFSSEVIPKQIVYVDQEENRFSKNEQGNGFIHERKEKLQSFDISLLAHDYDLRIACATEIQTSSSSSSSTGPSNAALSNKFHERHKYRTTFQVLKNPKWKIDYTEVITQTAATAPTASGSTNVNSNNNAINTNVRKYELEFELKKEVTIKWLQLSLASPATSTSPDVPPTPSPELKKLTEEIFAELKFLLDYCIPSEIDTQGEVELKPVEVQLSLQLTPHIQDINRIVKPISSNSIEFLGSMPINLFRSSLANVLQSDYYLTEKTDGVRYLLYILPHPLKPGKQLAIFMNRSKELFTYSQSELIGGCFPVNSILDGEVVYNHHHKKSVFLIFDLLAYDSNTYVPHPFQFRYQLIKERVMPSFHSNMKQAITTLAAQPGVTAGPPPLELLVHYKKFLPKEQISDLLKLFRIENGDRIYYENELRYHKSDGIIFQPNTSYQFSRYYDLLKWKWSDLRSIDLKIQIPNITTSSIYSNPSLLANITAQDIFLLCTGPGGTLINISKRGDYNVGLGYYDSARLLVEVEEVLMKYRGIGGVGGGGGKHLDNMIVEVIYDVQVGKWMYSKIRYDKNEPNYIDSVLGVFIEQAEAISIEELEFTMIAAAKKFELDYDTHLNKMKNNILDWQRKR